MTEVHALWRVPEEGERAIITGHEMLKSFIGKGCVVSGVSSFLKTNPKMARASSKVWVMVDGVADLEYGMCLRDLMMEPEGEA